MMRLNSKKEQKKIFLIFFLFLIFILLFWNWDKITFFYLKLKENYQLNLKEKREVLKENLALKNKINILESQKKIRVDKADLNENYFYKDFFLKYDAKNSFYLSTNLNLKKGEKIYFFDNQLLGFVDTIKDNFVKIKTYFYPSYKENYQLISDYKVVYKGVGVGDSLGLIVMSIPRELKISENSYIVLDDGSGDVVAVYDKENFQEQNIYRKVYFKIPFNINQVYKAKIKIWKKIEEKTTMEKKL